VRIITVCAYVALFGLSSADASLLQFTATTERGEIVSFTLDTTVPNTYDPILYPNLPIRGVYLNAVHDLDFEGASIILSRLLKNRVGRALPLLPSFLSEAV